MAHLRSKSVKYLSEDLLWLSSHSTTFREWSKFVGDSVIGDGDLRRLWDRKTCALTMISFVVCLSSSIGPIGGGVPCGASSGSLIE